MKIQKLITLIFFAQVFSACAPMKITNTETSPTDLNKARNRTSNSSSAILPASAISTSYTLAYFEDSMGHRTTPITNGNEASRHTLTLSSDGVLFGVSACNRFQGRYNLSASTLEDAVAYDFTIAGLIQGMAACADSNLVNEEQKYLNGLDQAISLVPTNSPVAITQLRINSRDGTALLFIRN